MNSISVLHMNTWGGVGGAFIAADRLHQTLLKQGYQSMFAYGRTLNYGDQRIQDSPHYRYIGNNNWGQQTLAKLPKLLGLNDVGHLSTFALPQTDFFQQATVLNFHNLHSHYFSYLALPTLTAHKPAILTLHDMWSFTGHCAYSYDCQKWQSGCGRCPYPASEPSIRIDGTALEWRLKNWIYGRSNLTIVAPSQWLAAQARQSMLNQFDIHCIPYGIDLDAYHPLDQQLCRTQLGIPLDKRVLLFGAQVLNDRRKGGDLLLTALQALPESLKRETILLTFGHDCSELANAVGMATINLGYLQADQQKAVAFSAADILVFPTRSDNLPLVLQESIACGTPMVSFRVGGVPDMVRPGVTGYLAEPEDAADLRSGIVKLLEDATLREQMRQNCRSIALAEYSLELQAQRYIKLYEEALQKS
jgi:glycosyltransferase involved in cell wall biosynthesis